MVSPVLTLQVKASCFDSEGILARVGVSPQWLGGEPRSMIYWCGDCLDPMDWILKRYDSIS